MRKFIILVHILLGLLLLFYNINFLPEFDSNYPDYSLAEKVSSIVSGLFLGVFSIISAMAFKKDKSWSKLALPLALVVLIGYFFYRGVSMGAYGGVVFIFIIPLVILLILEVIYFISKKY